MKRNSLSAADRGRRARAGSLDRGQVFGGPAVLERPLVERGRRRGQGGIDPRGRQAQEGAQRLDDLGGQAQGVRPAIDLGQGRILDPGAAEQPFFAFIVLDLQDDDHLLPGPGLGQDGDLVHGLELGPLRAVDIEDAAVLDLEPQADGATGQSHPKQALGNAEPGAEPEGPVLMPEKSRGGGIGRAGAEARIERLGFGQSLGRLPAVEDLDRPPFQGQGLGPEFVTAGRLGRPGGQGGGQEKKREDGGARGMDHRHENSTRIPAVQAGPRAADRTARPGRLKTASA